MTRFQYTALTKEGTTVSGSMTAASGGAAHIDLVQRGLQPVAVTKKKRLLDIKIAGGKVPRKDVMRFSRQMATFLKAGIPVLEAIEVIAEETANKPFKKALNEMIMAIAAGDTFAVAAGAHAEAFPPYYLGILGSAELSGSLDIVLDQLADYIEREADARTKVVSALIYPSIVVVAAIGTVAVLAGFVLPKFKTFFSSLNAKLPAPTRALMAIANLVTGRWYEILGGLLIITVTFLGLHRTKAGRERFDALILRIPIAGDLIRHVMIERVCRILASMMRAGVPLPDALNVSAEATSSNATFRHGLEQIRDAMIQGHGLAGPLAQTKLFPSAARQMFRVGEETGTLDDQLQVAADFYSRELDEKIKRFTSFFEPAVIVFVGVVVGFVAIALVSAMYGIYRQVHV